MLGSAPRGPGTSLSLFAHIGRVRHRSAIVHQPVDCLGVAVANVRRAKVATVHDDVTTAGKNVPDDVPGSKYPRVQNCVISPAHQSGMSIVKHDDVCGLPRSKTTSAHRIEAESLRTAYAGHLEQATAG